MRRSSPHARGSGDPSPAPIFIVGLPRSGSTLIEQILASHSRVEGTMELPNIINLVREFDDMERGPRWLPGDASAACRRSSWLRSGARYLKETAALRSGREHFTDKLPNNFSHVGLIHAILPNATIIDARRHPMDACFSTFRQHFADGQTFSYDLEDLGRYYRCLPVAHGSLGRACCRAKCCTCSTRRWCASRRRTSAACSSTAGCRSSLPA